MVFSYSPPDSPTVWMRHSFTGENAQQSQGDSACEQSICAEVADETLGESENSANGIETKENLCDENAGVDILSVERGLQLTKCPYQRTSDLWSSGSLSASLLAKTAAEEKSPNGCDKSEFVLMTTTGCRRDAPVVDECVSAGQFGLRTDYHMSIKTWFGPLVAVQFGRTSASSILAASNCPGDHHRDGPSDCHRDRLCHSREKLRPTSTRAIAS